MPFGSHVVRCSSSHGPKRKLCSTRRLRRYVSKKKNGVTGRRYLFTIVVYGKFQYGLLENEPINCEVALEKAQDLCDWTNRVILKYKDFVDFDFGRDVTIHFPTVTSGEGWTKIMMTVNLQLRAKQFFQWFGLDSNEVERGNYSCPDFGRWLKFFDVFRNDKRFLVVSCGSYHDVNSQRNLLDNNTWMEFEVTTPNCVADLCTGLRRALGEQYSTCC